MGVNTISAANAAMVARSYKSAVQQFHHAAQEAIKGPAAAPEDTVNFASAAHTFMQKLRTAGIKTEQSTVKGLNHEAALQEVMLQQTEFEIAVQEMRVMHEKIVTALQGILTMPL